MSLRKVRSNNQFKDSWLCNDFYKSRLERQCIKQHVKCVVNICVEKTGESALKSHAKPSS